MSRIYALLAIALLVTQVLSAPAAKQDVGERKATNKEAANLEEELHKQAGEGKKDTPETSEPSPGHKPRGALGQLMEAAAEAEDDQAATKTEDDAKLQNVIYSIYNNPEVLKALLRAGESKSTNKISSGTLNGEKRDEEEEDEELLRSNIIKKDGDELYGPMSASKKVNEEYMMLNQPKTPILHHKYDTPYDADDLYGDENLGYDNEVGDYPDGPLTPDEEEALEELDNGIETEDEDLQESDESPDIPDEEEDEEEEEGLEDNTAPNAH